MVQCEPVVTHTVVMQDVARFTHYALSTRGLYEERSGGLDAPQRRRFTSARRSRVLPHACHPRTRGSAVAVYQLCTHPFVHEGTLLHMGLERRRNAKHAAIHPVSSKGGAGGSEMLVGGGSFSLPRWAINLAGAKGKGSLWRLDIHGHRRRRGSRPKGPRAGRRLVESQSQDSPCAAAFLGHLPADLWRP